MLEDVLNRSPRGFDEDDTNDDGYELEDEDDFFDDEDEDFEDEDFDDDDFDDDDEEF